LGLQWINRRASYQVFKSSDVAFCGRNRLRHWLPYQQSIIQSTCIQAQKKSNVTLSSSIQQVLVGRDLDRSAQIVSGLQRRYGFDMGCLPRSQGVLTALFEGGRMA